MKRKPTRREKQLEKDLQHAITHWQGVVANLQANNRAEKEKHAAEMKKLKEELQERRLSLKASITKAMFMFMASLMALPLPSSPTCWIFTAWRSSTGRTRSTRETSPPR